ncbi:protein MALE DISCOVERER 2 isoform X3 [Daucus carota subsp. sativus]|uniref:protein MALE DISCOVERER 2 isoform X3 n=1 Tax=Daucus carota subsp. sativus TaxID=79200 RepID=UPI0007EF3203|nr:PREDICTED: protein MALE DISCOVERER 2-like isoform X3 [Daucus carota subsp. sativus]
MASRCNLYGIQLYCSFVLILVLETHGHCLPNSEVLALLGFRDSVKSDPHGVFSNWDPNDCNPCKWSGVRCVNNLVQMLDLKGLSLEGVLAPDLGKLANLKILISHGGLESLKKSESFLPTTRTLKYHLNMLLPMFKFEEGSSCSNADDGCDTPSAGSSEQQILNLNDVVRRRLAEQSSNLAAAPARDASPAVQIIALPSSRSSGSFPAVPKEKRKHSLPPAPSPAEPPINEFHMNKTNESGKTSKETSGLSGNTWIFIIGILSAVLVLVVALALFFICRTHAVAGTSDSWKMGLTGQLQKAFVTGVPKLNRAELVTACEDFSNIIETHNYFTVYKGTLSSGVEVAVFSTTINSLKDWSAHSEQVYRKKIEVLSRVNHKNFVNLIGHCEEDEPFTRMMVLEYAPNGSLSEHLHIMELDHLDWTTRIRIIMGTAYCLQYMHELNPPLPHSNLNANAVLLTEDYAAKIVEVDFWKDILYKSEVSVDNKSEHSKLGPLADTEENVYCFGVLLLEIISGKFPYSEEHGPLVDWAASYLKDKRSYLVDPTLKTFENDQLDIICEVIQDCIQQDARKRPTIKEIVSKLRQVINVSPEAAVPRQSPLWWAELEISSAETS